MISAVLAVALAAVLALAVPHAHAEASVDVSAFGNTVVVGLSGGPADLRVWLEEGNAFESAKSEDGWTSEILADGSARFEAGGGARDGATFGLVSASEPRTVYWQAGAESGSVVLIEDAPEPSFRILPERPNIGSTVRVVGEGLEPLVRHDFYIGGERVAAFDTDSSGAFAGTAKIPLNLSPGRTEFRLGDLTYSINLSFPGGSGELHTGHALAMDDPPGTVNRGDSVSFGGAAEPAGQVVVSVRGSDGALQNTLVAQAGPDGRWSAGPVTVPFDAPFGTYVIEAADGTDTRTASMDVLPDRVMDIRADKTVLRPGETIRFTGTALPGELVQMVIENPAGDKVGAELVTANGTGHVEYEFRTEPGSQLGPYTLVASQAGQIEFVHTSLGPMPQFNFNIELDKNTYARGERVEAHVSGDPSDSLLLRVISEKGLTGGVEYDARVVLDPEGRGLHEIPLEGNFTEGTYTVRLSKGNIYDEETFGVDLGVKRANLALTPVKETYARGEIILLIGNTLADSQGGTSKVCSGNSKNIPIVIRLVDPSGDIVRSKPTFVDNNCSVVDSSFTVPDDAELGTWKIVSNIRNEAAVGGTGPSAAPAAAPDASARGPAYDGCVPAAEAGKWVILACKIDVDGANPRPVLRLVDEGGNIVWQRDSELANEIFDAMGQTRGFIQGAPAAEPAKAASRTYDHECGKQAPVPTRSGAQSNQTLIDLGGISTVVCPYGTRYNDPPAVCHTAPGVTPVFRNNSTSVQEKTLGDQTVLYTCDDGSGATVSATRTVTIVDEVLPEIRFIGPAVVDLLQNEEYVDGGTLCSDNADESPALTSNLDSLDTARIGVQKVTFTCTDASGNAATASKTVTVKDRCSLDSYADPRGEIGRNILGCGGGFGFTLVESPFEVVDIHDRTLRVSVGDGGAHDVGKIVLVTVSGSERGTEVRIEYEDGGLIQRFAASSDEGEVVYHWLVTRGLEPGTYTITATRGDETAEAEYIIPLE